MAVGGSGSGSKENFAFKESKILRRIIRFRSIFTREKFSVDKKSNLPNSLYFSAQGQVEPGPALDDVGRHLDWPITQIETDR